MVFGCGDIYDTDRVIELEQKVKRLEKALERCKEQRDQSIDMEERDGELPFQSKESCNAELDAILQGLTPQGVRASPESE